MNRFLYFCSIVTLIFFVCGSYFFPTDMIMWFASTTDTDNAIRLGLVTVLALLLFSMPPRSIYLRVLLGAVSLGLIGWTASTFYADQLRVLDALVYLQLSVVLALAALEITYDYDAPRTAAPEPQPQLHAYSS